MSKSFNTPNADPDTSAANTVANARYQTVLQLLNNTPKFSTEWFRLKEEEIKLRSHLDTQQSNCTGLVVDRIAGDVGGIHAGEANVNTISSLECNPLIGRSSRGLFPPDLINSPQLAIVDADDPQNDILTVIAGDPPGRLFAGSSLNKSDLPNAHEGKEGVKLTGSITSPTERVLDDCDFEKKIEPPHANAGIGIETAIDTCPTTVDVLPPVPFSLDSYGSANGQKHKKISAINILRSMNDEGPSPPFCIRFADAAITEKLSRVDAATAIKSETPTSTAVLTPPTATSICTNQGQVPNEDIVPHSRSMRPEVGINHGLFSLPPVSQAYVTHPRACAHVLSQSVPNDSFHEEEGREDAIVIPEAFLVEANAPVEVRDVGVAELVEPDQSTFPMKKRHACVVSILFAAIVVALGVSFHFTRLKPASNEIPETPLMLSPSLQPTFLPPSSQSSFFRPSSQPSLSIKYAIQNSVLQRNVTFDMMEPTNARILALNWITDKEPLTLFASDENLFQRYICLLLAFEYSTLGWLSNANSYVNECDWLGVECDEDEHVVKLMLDDNSLEGTMLPEIVTLQYLQMLSMSNNALSGTIPIELGNMKDVSKLDLSANDFIGTLPSEIGNLKELTVLSLNGNDFTGMLPWELGNLNKLTSLSLEFNQLAGNLPSELGNLRNLTQLILNSNNFNGTLPSELGNLNTLNALNLGKNLLVGTLPTELGNLGNLTELTLSENQITGTLPLELRNLNMLNVLNLDSNELTGTLPSEIGDLNKLTHLDLYSNEFTGTLPSELGNLKEMTYLVISQNRFHGALPTEIGNLKELGSVAVNENRFNGTVPSELGQLNQLSTLWLFSNEFSGTLPSELGQLTLLNRFWIDGNHFIGTLPPWIGHFTNLASLYVGGNGFAGTLPSELGLLKDLDILAIEKNEFNGTFPSWIGDLTGLSMLWLNDNQFTGTFPSELEENLDLESLCLRNNNFTGSIPADIQVIDCKY